MIWWPLLEAKRETAKKGRIQLDGEEYSQTMEASFGDCWLRNGPLVEKITFVEIGQRGDEKRERMGRRIELFREGWRMKTLVRGAVANVSGQIYYLAIIELCSYVFFAFLF